MKLSCSLCLHAASDGRQEDAVLAAGKVYQGSNESDASDLACTAALFAVADGLAITPRAAHSGARLLRLLAMMNPAAVADKPRSAAAALDVAFGNDRTCQGGAATLVAAVLDQRSVVVINAGDSRAYRWRNGTLLRLSHDHTQAQAEIDAGRLSALQAAQLPLGWHGPSIAFHERLDAETEVHVAREGLSAGDRFLLCSDGLTAVFDDATLLDCWQRCGDNAGRLVEEAVAAGADDDIAAVLVVVHA